MSPVFVKAEQSITSCNNELKDPIVFDAEIDSEFWFQQRLCKKNLSQQSLLRCGSIADIIVDHKTSVND